MQEGFYSSAQAAAMIRVHERTVLRWCKSGKLAGAYLRHGSRKLGWRIPPASVVAVMQEGDYGALQDRLPA